MTELLRIGISACLWHQDSSRSIFNGRPLVYLERSLLDYLAQPGVFASMVPPASPNGLPFSEIVDQYDGIVFHGGVDMSPTSYGENPVRPEWKGDLLRDAYELELFRLAFAKKLPIFGICRGAQLINVALGGTLYQDIQYAHPHARVHRDANQYEKNQHDIQILPDTVLGRLYPDGQRRRVNSVHHQAICTLGQNLVVEAISADDGIIEAIRYSPVEEDQYCFAVQWHPEFQTETDFDLLPASPLLQEFLAASRKRKSL
jgi:putative glutamine amidotransferase